MAAISPLTLIFQAVDQASPVVKNIIAGLKENVGVVGALSLAYNETQQAIASFAAQGQKAYDLLIGQNVELQGQLLATQASLVATNKVISEGFEVKDPTRAIQTLTEPVNQAIADLRKGSFDLVGVTSNDLIPLFQSVANESSKIGANLEQSAQLALGFGAATQTLKIPLQQTSNELKLILEGQVSSENRLATALNLNNETVNRWKSQNIFVEELNKKLAVFRAGNALAAQTIDGVTANIKELFLEFGRVAGVPLLQPAVTQLNTLYEFIKNNKDAIQEITVSVVNFFLELATKAGSVLTTLQPVFQTLSEAGFRLLAAEGDAAADALTLVVDIIVNLVTVATPLLQVLANIVDALTKIVDTPFGRILLETIATIILLNNAFTAATVIVSLFTAALAASGGGVVGFGTALVATFPILEIFPVAITAGTTALTAFTASAAAAGGGVAGFAAAAAIAVLPLAALAAAVGLAFTVRETKRLEEANDALDEFSTQAQDSGDRAVALASKLKALNDAERDNGKLTQEQAKQLKTLQIGAAGQLEGLKSQLAAIKELVPANEDQKNAQAALIKQTETSISLLQKQSGAARLLSKDLPQLGNDYEQLSRKVSNALAQFNKPASADQFKASSKEIVDLSQKQFEIGQLTAEQVIAQLNQVRNDTRVEFELRRSAADAITKIRQGETDKQVKISEEQQQKIQGLIASEGISQAEGQRQITQAKFKELNLQLDAVRAAIAAENALRKSQVDTQVAGIDAQIAEAQKRLAEAQGKGDKGGARIANEDITRLESQKAAAQASLGIDSDRLSQLKSQQQKFSTEIAQTEGQERQRVRQERLKDFDEQQQILDSQNAQRLITQEQFNDRSLQIAQGKAKTELAQLEEQRGKLSANDKEGQEAIAAKEAQVRQKLAESTEKFEADKSKIRIAAVDTEQKQLADKLAEGEVTQQQFNQQSLALTQKRLQAELDEVQRQRARLKAGDTQRADELNAQEADIRKRSVDAIAQNQEAQVQLIEQAQKKATDIVSQSESDRLVEIDKLEATQTIRKVEAEKLRTDAIGDRIKKELQLEKDNLAQLEALPKFSDPAKEEGRQSQIRASRLKTSQLTKSLIDNEIEQREKAYAVIEDNLNREIQGIQNTATIQNQALEKQEQLQDFISKSLENQIKLLQSRKDLISSVAGFYEGELNVLKETTKNQRQQAQLGETAAEIRLNSARASFEIEKQITKEKLEQQQIDLAIKELELQGEQAGAASATLKAQAEQKKVEAKPGATQGEKDAAALDVQAAVAKELGLQLKGALLGQEKAIAATQGQQELDNLGRTQQLQDDQNVAALANARVSKGQGRRELGDLRDNILRRGAVDSTRDYAKNLNFNAVGGGLVSQLSQLQAILQGVLPTGTIPQTTQRLRPVPLVRGSGQGTVGSTQAAAPKPVGTVNITVNNQFTKDDATMGKAADKVTQGVRKELYDLGILLTRQTN
jgi:hypothetical protein